MSRRRILVTALVAGLLTSLAPSEAAWQAPAGGWAFSRSTAVGPGSSPSPTVSGRTVSLTWPAATLESGAPVAGYVVRRYDLGTSTERPIDAGTCASLVSTTGCTHVAAPPGSWRYTITAAQGQWRGPESPAGSVTVAPPALVLSAPTAVKPGATLTGSLSGFVGGDSISYRLDSAAGPLLTGTLAGVATPTGAPASGTGSVSLTIPAGTPDGVHPVFAVASPSGESAAYSVAVDGTAPPAPVFIRTPADPSGDSATFEFTEADESATLECKLDSAASYTACSSPVDLALLAAGSHTFSARATDPAGNIGAAAGFTWSVSLNVPNVATTFPSAGARLGDAGFTAGCATSADGDVCGTADDTDGITAVAVSLRQVSTGLYWNGVLFTGLTELFLPASGTDSWSYAIPAAALAEGGYVLRARATDATATIGFDSMTFTIDRTAPPAPTITTAPPATSGPVVSVAYSTADATATFECRLDAGPWAACTSPRTLSGLGDGSHTFEVRAVDAAGNTSASAGVTWTVDATAPTVSATSPPAGALTPAAWTAGCGTLATGDLCGTSSDVGTGVAAVALSVRRSSTGLYWDGSAFASSTETWLAATGTTGWSYALEAVSLTDGTYAVRYRVTDNVANATTANVTFTMDGAPPPQPALLSAPTSPGGTTAFFDFTVAETGVSTQCSLDGAAWSSCTAPVTSTGLLAGAHILQIRAVDAAGNLSTVRRHDWTVDPDLPSVALTFPSTGRSYNDATFAAGCSTPGGDICGTASDPQGVARVEVSLRRDGTGLYWDGAAFTQSSETWGAAAGTSSWSSAFAASSFPAEGGYTISARVTDTAGNTATATDAIAVDRTAPPVATITSGPSGTTNGVDTFTFTGEAGAAFECQRDGGPWAACTSPVAVTSADGPHSFAVRAVDAAGNVGAAVSRSWTVDTLPPNVTVTFAAEGGTYNNAGWTPGCTSGTDDVCGTATDAGGAVASVEVSIRRSSTGLYWDGAAFSGAAPTWLGATGTATWSLPFAATAFPGDGTYVLSARATDATGSVSVPVVRTFAVDRTGPGAAALSAPNRGIVGRIETGDTLTLTFSEAIAPASLIAGWNGTGGRNITIRQSNSTSNELLTFYNDANTARIPLGSVQLKRGDYGSGAVVWGSPAVATRSTVTLSGTTLTIMFGTPDNAGKVTTAATAANMVWSPRAGVTAGTGITDLAGNLGTTTTRTETDLDSDF